MPLKILRTAVLAAFVAVAASDVAVAATASVEDPADARPSVSGAPTSPDVARVDITYDPSGTVSLTATFHNALDSVDTSENYAFWAEFTLGQVRRAAKSYTCVTTTAGDQSGQHHVLASSSTFHDQATVTGYDGKLAFDRTVSDDKRRVTIVASSPVIASRDYSCATYELRARRRGPASHPDTRYDEHCDCWYFAVSSDTVGETSGTGTDPAFYFDGRRPPPLPACANGADDDGDGLTDADYDRGCSGAEDGSEVNEACANGVDDDGDGGIDYPGVSPAPRYDDGCTSATDTTEFDPAAPACSNSRDDDGDAKADTNDPGCSSPTDVDEQTTFCENDVDDDGDGRRDERDHDGGAGADRCDRVPRLNVVTGKSAIRRGLLRRYPSFRRAASSRIERCRVLSDVSVTCAVTWRHRRRVHAGRATVHLAAGHQRVVVKVKSRRR